MVTKEEVLEALKDCYDPEIPVNIVDLGLIYEVSIVDGDEADGGPAGDEPGEEAEAAGDETEGGEAPADGVRVDIDMTLTSVGCPEAPMILDQVERIVNHIEGVADCRVELVYEPPWSPEKATEEGRAELELMGVPIPNYD